MIKATETLVARFRAQVDGDTPIDGAEAVDAVAEFVRAYVAHQRATPQSVESAAQRAAEEMVDLANKSKSVRAEQITSLILSHLAPHCGVNQGLLEACKGMLRAYDEWDRRAIQQGLEGQSAPPRGEVWKNCKKVARTAIAAAEAVQTQPKEVA